MFGRYFFGHSDVPRLIDANIGAAMWSITTNPLRPARNRWKVFCENVNRLVALQLRAPEELSVARSCDELENAIANGHHVILPAVQGGNAIEGAPNSVFSIPESLITRITLVHLTTSCYGATSSPLHSLSSDKSLSPAGCKLIEEMNLARIFVDLAHIHEDAFWRAVDVHSKELPLIVTHTGVKGVCNHWRNLSDKQIRAVADSGGVVGIIFASNFLGTSRKPSSAALVVDHIEHLINVGGEKVAAIGTDFDGAIITPVDLFSPTQLQVLVEEMMNRKWSSKRIQGVLGENFISSFRSLRPRINW